jgi:ubiquinone/menaquinone biosynthesis C-methylase UbiE
MTDQKITPEPLLQMQFAMAATRVLSTGVQHAYFTHLASGPKTAREVAKASGTNERAARMLLDGLVVLGLLLKKVDKYELGPLASEFLVKGKETYLGQMMEADEMWKGWSQLPEVVKTGKPAHHVEEKSGAESFFPALVRSLHIMNRGPAQRAAKALQGSKKVLDVACGSGVWGISLAETDPATRVTAQDFSGVLEVTKEYVKKHGLADRFDYLAGDLKTVDYGKNRFDAAILGNIVHSEGERSSRALFAKLHAALVPGGKVAIVDMIPNDERTGPPFAVLFALNMLLHTGDGDTYTLSEYRGWLKDAGFSKVETADIGSHSPLIIGIK